VLNMVKGQIKYIPKEVMEEIGRIKFEFNMDDDGECLRKLAKRSGMIRELRFNIDFGNKRRK
jgi:hypothetical protein